MPTAISRGRTSHAVGEFAKQLRSAEGKNIWLVGGAELIAAFLDEEQIDEFIIHVIPSFIGEGIPLIHPRHRSVPLALLSCRSHSDGVVRLRYSVLRHTSGEGASSKVAALKST